MAAAVDLFREEAALAAAAAVDSVDDMVRCGSFDFGGWSNLWILAGFEIHQNFLKIQSLAEITRVTFPL